MNEFLEIIQRNKFIYAIGISIIATILIINSVLNFIEKVKEEMMIGIGALLIFIILFYVYVYYKTRVK